MRSFARTLTVAATAGLLALSGVAAEAQGLPTGAKRGYTTGNRVGGPIVGGVGAVVGGAAGTVYGAAGYDPGRCAYGACKGRHHVVKKKARRTTTTTTTVVPD